MLTWDGKSCQGMKSYGRDRGSAILGTNGTVLVDRDGYDDDQREEDKQIQGGQPNFVDGSGWQRLHDRRAFRQLHCEIRSGENLPHPFRKETLRSRCCSFLTSHGK